MSMPENEIQGRLFDRSLTRRMLVYIRPYKRMLFVAVALLLLMALGTSTLPLLLKNAIDQYLLAEESGLSGAQRVQGLSRLTMWYAGLAFALFVLRYAQSYLMSWIGERIIYDMRADLFGKIVRLPLRFMDRNPVGRMMTRVTSDVDAIQRFVTDGLVGLAADLFALFAIMGFMIYVSPRLAFTLFALLPVLFGLVAWINHHVRRAHRDVRRRQSALNAYLQEMITGMTTIQLFNREQDVRERFGTFNRSLRESWIKSVRWLSYSFPLMEILNALSFSLVLLIGGWAILSGSDAITVGVVVAFLAYIRDFYRPLEDLSDKSTIFQSAMASAERIFALFDESEDVPEPASPVDAGAFQGRIVFDRVWFAYNDDDWVLKNLSFTIEPGEAIAIVGATGAGKTSIISVLARFYDVQRGSVQVDGVDLREYRTADLRKRIGLVLQDPFIFSGSVADNISLLNPEITREQIEEAASYVNADRFIRALPQGYDTPVQERGITLSTGQKQLLALARALVQNPDILLVLDEATANIDTESEQWIQDALRKVMRQRTSIIIAHRLSTIRGVDRILVMRGGELVEQGSHQALISRDGYYRRLYELLAHTPV
jgi:ATP-binding cassette, subfamily B, multidrug efflux pump